MGTFALAPEVFCSYAHQDESLSKELEKHMSLLQRQGLISFWYDQQIDAGAERAQTIDRYLARASVILLLISADFLASDYCYAIEMQHALHRHQSGQARVIPIILRPVDWQGAPFAQLQCLPGDGRSVIEWDSLDAAFRDITKSIRHVLENSSSSAPSTAQTLVPIVWSIPYPRNPLFIGHENLLMKLTDALGTGHTTALTQPQAISGLGGIGKTQIAIEYAYRSRQDYQAVLWSQAESREALISGYLDLAKLLNVPAKDERDQMVAVNAVKEWLRTHSKWLLILDNADDVKLVREFMPSASDGHILLTTRAQAMGTLARSLEVGTLETELGAMFLLRRAGLLARDASLASSGVMDVTIAREMTQQMGGLPLALDQAGAYIEESACSLADYHRLYKERRIALLRRRGRIEGDHPESVATTWSLSFERVGQANPAAAELLRLCAYLAPDAIPEEMITKGAEYLGLVLAPVVSDPLAFNDAITVLRGYSLVRRNAIEKTLNVHRLVQAVLKDTMNESMQSDWRQRTICMVNAAFPTVEFTAWHQCERYLPHALICAEAIEQENLTLLEAASLLHRVGWYLDDHARYSEAEPLYRRALAICEQQLGLQHPHTAACLNNLALLYDNWGKDEQAEPLYQRALEIYEQQLGPEHIYTATSLNNLAGFYDRQGKYEQAELLYRRALTIREQQLGPQHPSTATSLSNLALLYGHQEEDEQAEPLYQRALEIYEQQLGPQHPRTATSLNNLARLYDRQGKYEQAEPLYRRALAIREQQLGPQHPSTVASLNNLVEFYRAQGKYEQAESLYQRTRTPRGEA